MFTIGSTTSICTDPAEPCRLLAAAKPLTPDTRTTETGVDFWIHGAPWMCPTHEVGCAGHSVTAERRRTAELENICVQIEVEAIDTASFNAIAEHLAQVAVDAVESHAALGPDAQRDAGVVIRWDAASAADILNRTAWAASCALAQRPHSEFDTRTIVGADDVTVQVALAEEFLYGDPDILLAVSAPVYHSGDMELLIERMLDNRNRLEALLRTAV